MGGHPGRDLFKPADWRLFKKKKKTNPKLNKRAIKPFLGIYLRIKIKRSSGLLERAEAIMWTIH